MQKIVDENEECSLFNLSVNTKSPFRTKHMSSWAATIDSIIHGKDILFVISTGNILLDVIRYFINRGEQYPDYLQNKYARLANPAQSSFALAVGSINHTQYEDSDWISLGIENKYLHFRELGLVYGAKLSPT